MGRFLNSLALVGCRICVIAGNISRIDVITHVPILCEETEIPYIYVPSKEVSSISDPYEFIRLTFPWIYGCYVTTGSSKRRGDKETNILSPCPHETGQGRN
ncbi:hypothetical protein SAY87_003081 [Trapa incisa]|uniref:Ribosomal protein eL8/eL30/eS12/Gadd45 domain-containing protein n=1 Tax=Trapa incisa TaxID=236973 RepID=A0AAN7KJZ4_9MYRT|nr:hypothetical protein SAY87_003081 [Trapa incisa]